MDYVEWVEQVVRGLDQAHQAQSVGNQYYGVPREEVAMALGVTGSWEQFYAIEYRPAITALLDAFRDLQQLGALESNDNEWRRLRLNQQGRRFLHAGLSVAWPAIFGIFLDADQLRFLTKLVELSGDPQENFGALRQLPINDVCVALGFELTGPTRNGATGHSLARQLEEAGMAAYGGAIGALWTQPTYAGCVRATRQLETELQRRVRELVAEYENPNVDLKVQVSLKTASEKAKFVRSVLGLVTTNTGVRTRYLLIGFDDDTHEFQQSVDPTITQNQVEQILNEYTEPEPQVRYHRIGWQTGAVGVVELTREQTKVPYRVKKDLGDQRNPKAFSIKAGTVFVRHGSHTLLATEQDVAELEAEGLAARKRSQANQ